MLTDICICPASMAEMFKYGHTHPPRMAEMFKYGHTHPPRL